MSEPNVDQRLFEKLYKIKCMDFEPTFVYLGHKDHRELEEWFYSMNYMHGKKTGSLIEWMGIPVLRVGVENHLEIGAKLQ